MVRGYPWTSLILKTLLLRSTSTPTLLMFQGYFPVICTYQTFATFWDKRTQKLAAFWNLAPRLQGVTLSRLWTNFIRQSSKDRSRKFDGRSQSRFSSGCERVHFEPHPPTTSLIRIVNNIVLFYVDNIKVYLYSRVQRLCSHGAFSNRLIVLVKLLFTYYVSCVFNVEFSNSANNLSRFKGSLIR